jgi:hypothetical protein
MRAPLTTAERNDAEIGMAWWNRLSESDRREWMARAGDTGVAADAWAEFKRAQDQL